MPTLPIQVGDVYGRLSVVKRLPNRSYPSGQTKTVWECMCECGSIKQVVGADMRSGHTSSCGCLNLESIKERQFVDKTGMRFGRLLVTDLVSRTPTKWGCKCDCGSYTVVETSHLTNKRHTRSCGCLKTNAVIKRNSIQGGKAAEHPYYTTWRKMVSRCNNRSDPRYRWYGALEGWNSVLPYWTLDRIDPFGDLIVYYFVE